MIIEEKLVLSNGRFLARETCKQFCTILLDITKKIKYNFIVKICQTSYACLRSHSDYIFLTSAWGTQEEFAEHQQNICNPQFCFLRPLEVLLARKNHNSELDLPSPMKLQVFGGHYRLEWFVPSKKPFWFAAIWETKLLGSHYLLMWIKIFQGGDREYLLHWVNWPVSPQLIGVKLKWNSRECLLPGVCHVSIKTKRDLLYVYSSSQCCCWLQSDF